MTGLTTGPAPQQYVLVPMSPTNAMGVAGFLISLVGLITGGLLSPIGLIVSLIGLSRPPRGLAVAGVVLGLLGTCLGILIVVAVVLGVVAVVVAGVGLAAAVTIMAMAEPEATEVTLDMVSIVEQVERQRGRDGYPPASLSSLNLDPQTLVDPWGRPYEYVLIEDDPGYDIISSGKDGQSGTEDDIAFSRLGDFWESFFQVHEDKNNGTVRIRMGSRMLILREDQRGGTMELDLGDRLLRFKGGQAGAGSVMIVPKDASPTAEAGKAEPEQPPPAPQP